MIYSKNKPYIGRAYTRHKDTILKIIISFILLIIISALIINPRKYINSCYNGLLTWARNVLPSLFPFMIITKILTEMNIFNALTKKTAKFTKFLFKAPPISSYAFIVSIVSGYPIGSKTICDLYQSGQISSTTATKLTTFCSTSGPIFVIGTVGTIMFNNLTFGYVVYISHIISSIINGIVFRNLYVDKNLCTSPTLNDKENQKNINNTNIKEEQNQFPDKKNPLKEKMDFSKILNSSMSNSILSILTVGGFITISFILIDVLIDFKILPIFSTVLNYLLNPFGQNLGTSICSGLIEITRGCLELSNLSVNVVTSSVIATGIITFGGFSIHLQSLSFLSQAKVNINFYFLQKIVHTLISCIVAFIIASIVF